MNIIEQKSDDLCPHCRGPFEIVVVRFGFRSTAMVASCPNCALAAPDKWGTAKTKIPDNLENSWGISEGIWQRTVNMLDQLNFRFKFVLAFMMGAVIAAAALRHGVHVYGGFSREEIRTDALMAIPFVALAAVFFRRTRRQR
jgi:hypothetical protein